MTSHWSCALPLATFAALLAGASSAAAQQFTVVKLNLAFEQRITRTLFDYTYAVDIVNSGASANQVSASVSSTSPHTTIIDGSLTFGDVAGGQGASSQDTFTLRHDRSHPFDPQALAFTFSVGNRPPVANAGPGQTVKVGTTVTLDGSGSTDADGDPLTFQWMYLARPPGSAAVLSDPGAVKPTFVADLQGDYRVQLVVHDGKVSSNPDEVRISSINSRPVANAGPDQTVELGALVQLDGSGSSDGDGDPLTFRWEFTSRPPGSTAVLNNQTAVNPTFVADRPGTYTVRLIVNDGFEDSAPDTVVITTANSRPVANAGPNQTVGVGATVHLDGSGSSDADGNPLTFMWSFASRPSSSIAALTNPSAVMPTFVADVAGLYVVQLIVNDGQVDSSPDTVSITAEAGNTPPVANAGQDRFVDCGVPVELDGSGSSDVDGDPLTFRWSFVSRPAGSTAVLSDPSAIKPTFIPDVPGTYVVQLIVNDGRVDSPPVTVTITCTENLPPVAIAGPNQSVPVGATVQRDGSDSSDPNGDPLTFSWSFVSVPEGSTASLSDHASAMPTFVADLPGIYVVQLIVSDGRLSSKPDTVNIATTDENTRPVANAGPDQVVPIGALVQLDGSGSSDLDNDPLTYRWALTSKPPESTAALSDPNIVNPTFVADLAGQYLAQLIVNDGQLDSDPPATVMITASESLLGCGSLVSGRIDAAAEVDQYTFEGQAGRIVTLTLSSSGWPGSTRAVGRVFSPSGDLVETLDSTLQPQRQLTLPQSGVFVIQLQAINLSSTGNYSLGMECRNPPEEVNGVLNCGSLIASSIDAAAEVDQYTFEGQAGRIVTLTLSSSGWPGSTRAVGRVFSPSGDLVETLDSTLQPQRQLTLPQSGVFVIQLQAINLSSTGNYSLGMVCLVGALQEGWASPSVQPEMAILLPAQGRSNIDPTGRQGAWVSSYTGHECPVKAAFNVSQFHPGLDPPPIARRIEHRGAHLLGL